jgi:hypothetical protein
MTLVRLRRVLDGVQTTGTHHDYGLLVGETGGVYRSVVEVDGRMLKLDFPARLAALSLDKGQARVTWDISELLRLGYACEGLEDEG